MAHAVIDFLIFKKRRLSDCAHCHFTMARGEGDDTYADIDIDDDDILAPAVASVGRLIRAHYAMTYFSGWRLMACVIVEFPARVYAARELEIPHISPRRYHDGD